MIPPNAALNVGSDISVADSVGMPVGIGTDGQDVMSTAFRASLQEVLRQRRADLDGSAPPRRRAGLNPHRRWMHGECQGEQVK